MYSFGSIQDSRSIRRGDCQNASTVRRFSPLKLITAIGRWYRLLIERECDLLVHLGMNTDLGDKLDRNPLVFQLLIYNLRDISDPRSFLALILASEMMDKSFIL